MQSFHCTRSLSPFLPLSHFLSLCAALRRLVPVVSQTRSLALGLACHTGVHLVRLLVPLRCMLRTVRASCRATATATACCVCHTVCPFQFTSYTRRKLYTLRKRRRFLLPLSPSEQQQTENNNNNNNNNYKLEHSNNCAQQQQQQHKNDKNDSCRRQSIRNYFGQSIKEIYAEPPKSSWPRKVQNKAWAPLGVCVCV